MKSSSTLKIVRLPLATDMAGNDLGIQGYVFGSGRPKGYMQGGHHGGEVRCWGF